MTTVATHIEQQTDTYLSDLFETVAEEWRPEFQRFVETGEADEGFLNYLNQDEGAQHAVESAFNRQVASFEGLAADLKKASGTEGEVQPIRTPSSISSRLAAVVEVALATPSARREQIVESGATELAASIPAKERDVLKEVVRSLDSTLAKVVGV